MTNLDEDLRAARLDIDRDALVRGSIDLARSVAGAPRRRRAPNRRLALGIAALVVVTPAAAAAAGFDPLRTGWFGNPAKNTEDADTSEWLNVCSPEYDEVIRSHAPATELPTGWSWAHATERLVADARSSTDCAAGGAGVQQQEVGIDSGYARYAICAWSAAAAEADSNEDRRRAGQELKKLANSELNHAIDGGGIVEFDNSVADEVLAGDVARARERARNNCEMWQ